MIVWWKAGKSFAPDKTQGIPEKKDHEVVNEIIANTIDAVQDSIINPSSWSMAAIDGADGRLDEWLLSKLISSWRNEVWGR